jgi:MOSC domain-containing protein YiiM
MGSPAVLSVNLADVRDLRVGGRVVPTGIFKLPASGRVAIGREGLAGDVQADRRVHGGPDQAVYAYAREDIDWWQAQLGRELENGTFGENLTLRGVEASLALVGERWRVGGTLLEVSAPRIPCGKLAAKIGDRRFVRTFAAAGRPGAYLRVIEDGEVGAGDPVEVVSRPDHGVDVALAARAIRGESELIPRLLDAPQLPERVRIWAERLVAAPAR